MSNYKFISDLETDLRKNASFENAAPMKAYMKNNFDFLGIKTEPRRAILKSIIEKNKQELKTNFRVIASELFNHNEREFHSCAIDILVKEFPKNYKLDDIHFIEKLITTNSWWDSVDVIAKYLLGGYLQHFPEQKLSIIEQFSNTNNLWLNRSVIIFQLSYKEKTDFDLLKSECDKHKHSNEFFIQKAIGWALRDYSRFNPSGVVDYVNATNLKPLSRREALRNI